MRKVVGLLLVGALAMAAGASAQAPNTTYSGPVHCVGSDRSSPGGKVVRYESDPTASARYGPGGELQSWTYVFLGRPDWSSSRALCDPASGSPTAPAGTSGGPAAP